MTVTALPPASSLSAQIAAEVRADAARKMISGKDIAEAINQTEMWVSRRLRGKVPMNLDDLALIASVLDRDYSEFLPDTRRSPRPDGGRGLTGVLPRLDSNQQPADYLQAAREFYTTAQGKAGINLPPAPVESHRKAA